MRARTHSSATTSGSGINGGQRNDGGLIGAPAFRCARSASARARTPSSIASRVRAKRWWQRHDPHHRIGALAPEAAVRVLVLWCVPAAARRWLVRCEQTMWLPMLTHVVKLPVPLLLIDSSLKAVS